MRVAVAALFAALLSAPSSTPAVADRADLGRTLATIPENGPFEDYGNVMMRRRTKRAGVEPVLFPHWVHRARFTCRVCHLEIGFAMRAGMSGVSRQQYTSGMFCGECHDGKIAFSVADAAKNCNRCHGLQPAMLRKKLAALAASLPSSEFGNGIDWAAAVSGGSLELQDSLRTKRGSVTLPNDLRQSLKLETTSPRSDVTFSHEEHFTELDCSSCHPEVFNIKKKGTETFSMENNVYGRFCGTCHMRVAFPMNNCRGCHPSIANRRF